MIIFVFKNLARASTEMQGYRAILDLLVKKKIVIQDDKDELLKKITWPMRPIFPNSWMDENAELGECFDSFNSGLSIIKVFPLTVYI